MNQEKKNLIKGSRTANLRWWMKKDVIRWAACNREKGSYSVLRGLNETSRLPATQIDLHTDFSTFKRTDGENAMLETLPSIRISYRLDNDNDKNGTVVFLQQIAQQLYHKANFYKWVLIFWR